MKHKHILAIILIIALLLRITFALIVPAFEKPDEKSHFEYIKYVADNKKLPVQKEGQYSAEFFQPPLYHVLASFVLAFVKNFTENQHYQVMAIRLLSVFVSMFTLYIVYKTACLLFKNKNLVLGIAAFASFLPSHINMNSTVTNANFADFLSALVIYMLLIILTKDKIKNKLIVGLGLVAGISLITRLSLIPAVLTIPFAFLIKYYPNIKKPVKAVAVIAVIALLVSGWLFARNFTLYGDFLGINAMKKASTPDAIKVDIVFAARLLGWTFVTFWASFGRTNNVFIGNLASKSGANIFFVSYSILLLVSLSSIYGLYAFFRKHMNDLSGIQKKSFLVFLFYLAVLGFSFVSFNLYDFQPQGRLFFPGISVISVFFTLGLYNLFEFRKKTSMFLPSYAAFLLLLNAASIISIMHYY